MGQPWKHSISSTMHVTITTIQERKQMRHGTNTLDALEGHELQQQTPLGCVSIILMANRSKFAYILSDLIYKNYEYHCHKSFAMFVVASHWSVVTSLGVN